MPHNTGGILLLGLSFRLVAVAAVVMDIAMLANEVLAGNDHDVPVSCVQVDGAMVTVAPAGSPVTVSIVDAGRDGPLVGTIASV